MDDVSLHDLLRTLAAAGEKLAPEIKRDIDSLLTALEGAKETKPTGGLTRKAHQLLQRLRNPFFSTIHLNAAKQANNRLVKKTQRAFVRSLNQTVTAFGLHQQALLERTVYEDAACVPPSREGVPVKDWDDLHRFATAMEERGIPLFVLGRMRRHEYDLWAKMAADGYRDGAYEEPDNVWNKLFHAGFLDAFWKNMSEDEAAMLMEVAARRDSPDESRLRDDVERRLGRRLDITPDFAAACESLLRKAEELSVAEAEALFHARGEQHSTQAEWLCKILSVPNEKKTQVEAFVGFICSSQVRREDEWRWDYLRYILEEATKAFERRHTPPAGWLPGLAQVFGVGHSFMARRFKDPAAFWALYAFVLENSETHRRLTEEKRAAEADEHAAFWRRECEYLDQSGVRYTLDEEGRPQFDPALDDEEETDTGDVGAADVRDAHYAEATMSIEDVEGSLGVHGAGAQRDPGTRSAPEKMQVDLFGAATTVQPSRSDKYGDLE